MKHISWLCFFFLLQAHASFGQLPNEPHIQVKGTYEIKVVPDILTMSLDISEVDENVGQAKSSVEKRSAQLISALIALDIKKTDINSAELHITPHYNWNNRGQVYIGTEVSRTLKITLRDLTQYDTLVRSIIQAQVARINSTQLSSTKKIELEAKVLQGAIDDAKTKAQLLIADFPEKIGPLHSISTSPRREFLGRSQYGITESAAQTSFEPGEISISASIEVIFYLTRD